MTSQFLPVFRSNATLDAYEMLPGIKDNPADLSQMLRFCHHLRIRGICALFMEGTPDALFADLHRSGRAFLHYLRDARDSEKVTSKADPFFDALACMDFNGAAEIARCSRLDWNNEEEYEDDFLYVLFLMKHFFLDASDEEGRAIIQRYEEVLDGDEDVHLPVCRAFLEEDEGLFDEALERLLSEREERLAVLESSGSILDEDAATEGNFCCEGLALLRLAARKRFETHGQYAFIPSVVLGEVSGPFDDDSWRNLGP